MFEAAESGDLNLIEGLQEQKILDLVTPQMSTILHIAVRFNQNKFTEQLLNLCPRLLLKANAVGETALHIAARVGNQEMVRLLIDSAGDVESEQNYVRTMLRKRDLAKEDTALHVCVRNGHLGVAKLLTDADQGLLDVFNRANESPLFLAVEGGFLDIAKFIMEKCRFSISMPSCCGSNGMNALHAAVIQTHRGNIRNSIVFIIINFFFLLFPSSTGKWGLAFLFSGQNLFIYSLK